MCIGTKEKRLKCGGGNDHASQKRQKVLLVISENEVVQEVEERKKYIEKWGKQKVK